MLTILWTGSATSRSGLSPGFETSRQANDQPKVEPLGIERERDVPPAVQTACCATAAVLVLLTRQHWGFALLNLLTGGLAR